MSAAGVALARAVEDGDIASKPKLPRYAERYTQGYVTLAGAPRGDANLKWVCTRGRPRDGRACLGSGAVPPRPAPTGINAHPC
jgi:hypothetical protein